MHVSKHSMGQGVNFRGATKQGLIPALKHCSGMGWQITTRENNFQVNVVSNMLALKYMWPGHDVCLSVFEEPVSNNMNDFSLLCLSRAKSCLYTLHVRYSEKRLGVLIRKLQNARGHCPDAWIYRNGLVARRVVLVWHIVASTCKEWFRWSMRCTSLDQCSGDRQDTTSGSG